MIHVWNKESENDATQAAADLDAVEAVLREIEARLIDERALPNPTPNAAFSDWVFGRICAIKDEREGLREISRRVKSVLKLRNQKF